MAIAFTRTLVLETEECCNCGVTFAMPQDLKRQRLDKGGSFYCPNGHSQHYTTPTIPRLKAELEATQRKLTGAKSEALAERHRREAVEAEKAKIERSHKRHLTRVQNGTCPCCKRSFANLRRHMASKHPDIAP